ncbi:hypothetical protein MRX96_019130 [Rhipicephalus microplus]
MCVPPRFPTVVGEAGAACSGPKVVLTSVAGEESEKERRSIRLSSPFCSIVVSDVEGDEAGMWCSEEELETVRGVDLHEVCSRRSSLNGNLSLVRLRAMEGIDSPYEKCQRWKLAVVAALALAAAGSACLAWNMASISVPMRLGSLLFTF